MITEYCNFHCNIAFIEKVFIGEGCSPEKTSQELRMLSRPLSDYQSANAIFFLCHIGACIYGCFGQKIQQTIIQMII